MLIGTILAIAEGVPGGFRGTWHENCSIPTVPFPFLFYSNFLSVPPRTEKRSAGDRLIIRLVHDHPCGARLETLLTSRAGTRSVKDVKAGLHREVLELFRGGAAVEEIALRCEIPLAAVLNVLSSPMARAELARAS